MTVVRGFVELMENPRTNIEDRHEITGIILDDLDRMADMAQDLLDYSKGDLRLNSYQVDLGDWLDSREGYLSHFFSAAKMELKIQSSYRGSVFMDPDRMRRVLMNIASNARDAMSPGGIFSVSTGQVGDYWELVLEDDGGGIPPEVRPRIFEHFVTHGKAYGTGLGLAITRGIVDSHGGTIEIQSSVAGERPGQPSGTRVFLRFPMRQI
jgi:signal transduction histidine kinase